MTNKDKRLLIDDYLDFHRELVKQYGKHSVVLLQNGSFFEIYNYRCPDGPNIHNLADLLNIQVSRKNKQILEVGRNNWEMAGFPLWAKAKFVQILLNAGYTVGIYIQKEENKGKFIRVLDEIISPSTNLDYLPSVDNNYLAAFYIETTRTVAHGDHYVIGASFIDLSTATNYIGEAGTGCKTTKIDPGGGLDWAYNCLKLYNPKEVVIHLNDKAGVLNKEQILTHLELEIDGRATHFYHNVIDNKYTRITFQNEFLDRVFPNHGMLTPIEYLGLERYSSALVSYLIVLEFAKSHRVNLVDKINRPQLIEANGRLVLTLNSIHQLGVVPDKNIVIGPNTCLLSILNNCSTALGKRKFKHQLLNPITNVEVLENRYNWIDLLRADKKYSKIKPILNQVFDIERLHRRLTLQILTPNEFYNLHKSNLAIIKLNQTLQRLACQNLTMDEQVALEFNTYIQFYSSYLQPEEICKYNLGGMTRSIFVKGCFPEIDNLEEEIISISNKLDEFSGQLSLIIEGKKDMLTLENNDKEGYFLTCTNKRAETLKGKLTKNNWSFLYSGSAHQYTIKNFTLKSGASSTKIFHHDLKEWGEQLARLRFKMCALSNTRYLEVLGLIDTDYRPTLHNVAEWVAQLDIIKTHAENADHLRLTRPCPESRHDYDKNEGVIGNDKSEKCGDTSPSYLHIEEIRHLIVEQLQPHLPYVTNNVNLGNGSPHNILCYGYNAVGKTTLQKSLALAIIMAQSGGFVPAKSMKFRPFSHLFTRISNVDNLLKGQSSYMVEMLELNHILKHANKNSFVCIDELVASTESYSGISTVVATLKLLHDRNCCLFMATHLHDLAKMKRVTSLSGLVIKHLEVNYDENRKILVYDRKLKNGEGTHLYGLEVSKYLGLPEEFMSLAFEVRNEILNKEGELAILNTKTSTYNPRVVVDRCEICTIKGKDAGHLHTHHIQFQCDADKDGNFEHFHKNVDHNLVVLCESCHHSVHSGKITIGGFQMTSHGRILNYTHNTEIVSNEIVDEFAEKSSEKETMPMIPEIIDQPRLVESDEVKDLMEQDGDLFKYIKETLKTIGYKRGYKKLLIERIQADKGIKMDYKRLQKILV